MTDETETYQQAFMRNPYAQIAVAMPQKYKLVHTEMHALAVHLCAFEEKRLSEGKPTHRDLLMQEATQWAKRLKDPSHAR